MSDIAPGVQVTLLTGDYSEGVVPVILPPRPLTRRQLRLWLLGQGITSADIEAAIGALPAGERDAALIEWRDSSEYHRDHPVLVQVAGVLGLTAEDIDAGWAQAVML